METRYQNKSKNGIEFKFKEGKGNRDYRDYINSGDKLYLISTSGDYPYTTNDLGIMIYFLITNKKNYRAKKDEVKKILNYIKKAFQGDQIPPSAIPYICEYGHKSLFVDIPEWDSCLKCPKLNEDFSCRSSGAMIYNIIKENHDNRTNEKRNTTGRHESADSFR